MEITAQHIVVEKSNNGPEVIFTPILVHELADGTYFYVNPRGFLKPLTEDEFRTMEDNYDDMTDE